MTKEVLLALKGLQIENADGGQELETITAADYYLKNGSHYVLYEEVTEGFDRATKNRLKFGGQMVELIRHGLVNVHMVFQENKKNLSNYNTPFGQILVGIDTKRITIDEKEDNIVVDVDYALDINYEFFSDCHIKIDIRSKENSSFTLLS